MPRGRKAKATEENKADIIVTEESNENVVAEEVEAAKTEEVKEDTTNTEVSVQEEEKTAPKKRGRKPNTAKAEPKETSKKRGRKPAAEKTEVKEAASKDEAEANIILQFEFGEFVSKDLVEKCKQAYKAENKTKIKSIDIYVKPSDKKAYYVVNDKSAGYVDLDN